jgi:signal transduction histidine kinase
MRGGGDHVLLLDEQGAPIYTALPSACRDSVLNCPATEIATSCDKGAKRRRGRLVTSQGTAYLCTADADLVASKRVFKRELELLAASIAHLAELRREIGESEALKARRLVHNLTSLNAHALQEIYSVINQDRLATFNGFKSQREMVKSELLAHPDTAARLFLVSMKNAAAVKGELAVFRKLNDLAPKVTLAPHPIHKVVLNVANYFFQDFSERQIYLGIDSTDVRVRLDYESIQVALYHLLDNAVKYAAPNMAIRVAFANSASGFELGFEMTSLFLDHAERARVYEDGFSGSQAHRVGKAGEGLGMRIVAELVRLNGATFVPSWGEVDSGASVDGLRYARNRFAISFPSSAISRPPRPDIVSSRGGHSGKYTV